MLCVLIMAGGKGTRFWPLSTEEKPKQFLNLLGEETMIQMTVNRLKDLIPMEQIFVVTGKQYVELVKEQLPVLNEKNIIVEPYGKNTAPCIALSAFHINKKFNNATIAVLPADHLIKDEKEFCEVLRAGEQYVNENQKAIVTIGMTPDRAETGYGYIQYEGLSTIKNEKKILKGKRFVEKPNKETAEKYLKDGHYLWNGGMFIWKSINILSLTQKYLSNTFDVLSEIAATSDENYVEVLEDRYNDVDSISIDYGIMEKSEDIYVIPGNFGWDDVGSWSAVERYGRKDENGCIKLGNAFNIEGKNNLIVSNDNKVIVHGLDDIYVVENDGCVVIGRKDDVDRIKRVKEKLEVV